VLGALGEVTLQVGEGDLGAILLTLVVAGDAEDPAVGSAGILVKEAFVDVADLFDVQDAEGNPSAFAGEPQPLQRLHGAQQGAVVDPQRLSVFQAVADSGAAFEPRETVGIEEAAAVSGKVEPVVSGAPVDGAEGREQSVPSCAGTLQSVLA
jgi:hypothetical protein